MKLFLLTFDLKLNQFFLHVGWNGPEDFSERVRCSLSRNFSLHQKNASHSPYSQNLLFSTVQSCLDVLFLLHKIGPFFYCSCFPVTFVFLCISYVTVVNIFVYLYVLCSIAIDCVFLFTSSADAGFVGKFFKDFYLFFYFLSA